MSFSLIAETSGAASSPGAATSPAINTTGANLIVISVSCFSNVNKTVSDSKGNTWSALTIEGSPDPTVELYYCVNPTVGTGHTFTVSAAQGIYAVIAVVAVSGSAATPLDQQVGQYTTTAVTSYQPGSITPSTNGCLVVAGLCIEQGTSIAINGSFTESVQSYSAGNNMGGGIAYLIQSAAAAVNPTWSWTTAGVAAAYIVSFKPASFSSFVGEDDCLNFQTVYVW